ncbi:MAG: multidrug transport system ATPase [Lachnospiraceae bacterium]|jgi:ABC-2 type transport system ATP-binding protein|nr:multidrug transport system ATPase [Lachnospiraceae bacterium]
MSCLLKIQELEKLYGDKEVVRGISFDLKEGEILGFLGPNGAGKSTTISMITGLEKSDNGTVLFEGKDTNIDYKKYLKSIGVVPQDLALYMDLSAYNNVSFFCSLYGFKGEELKMRVKQALIFVGLWERRKEKPSKFSGGMKRRLNIACAIAHTPNVLIMDEPTVGIDPQSRNHILETIKTLNQRGTSVIYVSHYMEEIDAICDHIVLMDKGTIIEDCAKEELKQKYKKKGFDSLEAIFLSITGTQLRDEE